MMEPTEKKIIFLNSYYPRTGHNFTSEVLKVFAAHQVLAHNRSETRLSSMLNSYYQIYNNKIKHDSDKEFLDHLFIKDLREKIISRSDNRYIMIKDTSFVGVDLLPQVFPDDIHILLLRDPARVFYSLFKAMRLTNRTTKTSLKRVGKVTGLYPYYYSKKVSQQILKLLPSFNNHIIIKYEDLVSLNDATLLRLKKLFHTSKSLDQIKEEINKIPVINSSFYDEVNAKKIWDLKEKTTSFNPLQRKGESFQIRKGIEMGSKKLRQQLGYI